MLGGAKALQGEDWTNPVKSVVKVEALPRSRSRGSEGGGADVRAPESIPMPALSDR